MPYHHQSEAAMVPVLGGLWAQPSTWGMWRMEELCGLGAWDESTALSCAMSSHPAAGALHGPVRPATGCWWLPHHLG